MIHVDAELCKGCGLCIEFCPMKVFEKSKKLTKKGVHMPVPVNEEKCTKCRYCELICPDFAIHVEVEDEVKKRGNR